MDSRWKKQLDGHGVHGAIDRLYNNVLGKEVFEEPAMSERARFLFFLEALRSALNQVDPEVAPFPSIDALFNQLNQTISQEVANFVSNGNVHHLVQANNQLSAHAGTLALLRSCSKGPETGKVLNEIRRVSRDIHAESTKSLKNLAVRVQELQTKVADAGGATSEIDKKLSELSGQMASSLNEFQKQFSEAQDKRLTQFEDLKNIVRDEQADLMRSIEDETVKDISGTSAKYKEALQKILDESGEKHTRIIELYELVSADTMSGAYQRAAAEEKSAADQWRRISLSLIGLTAFLLLLAYGINLGLKNVGWEKMVSTFSLSAVLLAGAGYAARQSAGHRESEKRARQFYLDVKALDPYISSLKEEERRELKIKLSERLFGQSASQPSQATDQVTLPQGDVMRLIEAIVQKIPVASR